MRCIDYRLPPRSANKPLVDPRQPPPSGGRFTPRGFVARSQWRPATSPAYQALPHEYTVKAKTAYDPWFDLMVIHIRRHGRKRRWGKRTFIYLGLDGWRYWTMEATLSETTLINRARNRR